MFSVMAYLRVTIPLHIHQCDVGIVVSIAAFQAVDPGSIPGHRNKETFCFYYFAPSHVK